MFDGPLENSLLRSALPKPERKSSWRRYLQKAMQESDPEQLTKLVYDAEEALFLRWRELAHDSNHGRERDELKAAADELLAIKKFKLGWPSFWD